LFERKIQLSFLGLFVLGKFVNSNDILDTNFKLNTLTFVNQFLLIFWTKSLQD